MLRENSLANLNRAVPRQANVAALVSSVSSVVYFVSYLLSNIMLAITQIFVIALNFINVTLMWLVWYDCRVRWTPVILKYLYHGVLYYFTILYCKAQKVVPLSQLYSCNICVYYLFSTRFRFWYGSITFLAKSDYYFPCPYFPHLQAWFQQFIFVWGTRVPEQGEWVSTGVQCGDAYNIWTMYIYRWRSAIPENSKLFPPQVMLYE